jgi:dienelactone hydrolase
MKWILILPMFLLVTTIRAADFSGSWLGTITLPDGPHPIRIHLSKSDQSWKGTAKLILDGVEDVDLTSLKLAGNQLKFTIKVGEQSLEFSGAGDIRSISGKVVSGSFSDNFQFTKIADVAAADMKKFFGVYQLDANEYMYVRTWDELGPAQLTAFHSDGKIRALHARSASEYFSGPGLLIPSPETSTYKFEDGTIEYREGSIKKSGQRLDSIREIEIDIPNKDRKISGSIALPEGKGPFPGVVLVHGSGAVSRDFLGPIAYVFAHKGIAALTYDKRHDFMDSGFEDLATDAAAAFRYLHNRSDIDRNTIGYLGASQGGWIAPLAATLEPGASFLILFSGAAVTPAEHEVMRAGEEAKAQGASQEEINEAVDGLLAQLEELRKEETRIEFEKQLNALKAAGKTKELEKYGSENPRFLLWYRKIMDYDPVPVLKNTKIPLLAVYGDLDLAVPPKENIEPLKRYLNEAGNKNVEVRILENANHVLLQAETGSRSEFSHLNRFAPGLFELITDWVLKTSKP